ncbi:MAG: Gfo/Idh/MocA family oxidoreductase [Planctomycetaceae bacterium]|nr:Gfo/Idh/MocA family oxidoreductase [Planctomycetaceae bacterium]
MPTQKTITYVQVGIGHRSLLYADALAGPFRDGNRLVAMCDSNPGRLELRQRYLHDTYQYPEVALYPAEDFVQMLALHQPDTVIVTSGPDATHDDYIVKAMEMGCDVVTEKPMTIDPARCRRIIDAAARTGRTTRVTFNYRYSPPRSQVKELLASGIIGRVLSVDFEWALNTAHGADYFRRWHRRKANSGGLMVHKATHHFDLVNWWLGESPVAVEAMGRRCFYGADSGVAESLGLHGRGERCHGCPCAAKCPFRLDMASIPALKAYYLDNERYDGYYRDRCVFSPDMDIEDTMNVMVRYGSGAMLSYTLNAFLPWEGYRIAFNGTGGRLEHGTVESTYIAGDGRVQGGTVAGGTYIRHYPAFAEPRDIAVRTGEGSHGGGDDVMLADLFSPRTGHDPLRRAAGIGDGSYSILIGIAANRSMASGQAVAIDSLVAGIPDPSWK